MWKVFVFSKNLTKVGTMGMTRAEEIKEWAVVTLAFVIMVIFGLLSAVMGLIIYVGILAATVAAVAAPIAGVVWIFGKLIGAW